MYGLLQYSMGARDRARDSRTRESPVFLSILHSAALCRRVFLPERPNLFTLRRPHFLPMYRPRSHSPRPRLHRRPASWPGVLLLRRSHLHPMRRPVSLRRICPAALLAFRPVSLPRPRPAALPQLRPTSLPQLCPVSHLAFRPTSLLRPHPAAHPAFHPAFPRGLRRAGRHRRRIRGLRSRRRPSRQPASDFRQP